MKDNVLQKLQQIPIPQDAPIGGLKLLLENLNEYPEGIKISELSNAYDYLRLLGVNEPETINTKYLGILISGWISDREKNQIHTEKQEVTSTTGGDLESQIRDYEAIIEQKREINERIKKDTSDVLDRKQKIADEQRRVQEEIKKAKEAELKTKGKKIYADVELKNKYQTSKNDEIAHEALKNETIDSLSQKIKDQLSDNNLQTDNAREKEVVARSVAVGILTQVNSPDNRHSINAKILETVGNSNIFESLGEENLIDTAKHGAITLALNEKSLIVLGRQAVKHLYGDAVSEMVFGPEVILVNLTINPQQNSNYEIDIQALNKNYGRLLAEQSSALDDLSNVDRPETVILTRIVNFTSEKEEILKKTSKDLSETEKIEELIKKFGIKKTSKSLVFQELETNTWVEAVLDNKTALNTLAEQTTNPSIFSSIWTVVSKNLFSKTAESVVAKVTAKEVTATVLGGLNPLQTALVWLGTELLSKIKQWIKKNPEKAAMIFGGLAFFGSLPFSGPLIALILAGLIASVTIGVGVTTTAVFGTLNLIRIVWSRIAVSLAVPLFVLFVVIPILTTLILFIINSGAYIVPPSPYSSSIGQADNPYMLVKKTANPSKLENSNSNQTVIYVVSIEALKGNLTNLKLVSTECKVIKKDKTNVECPPEYLDDLEGAEVVPGNVGAFSFTGIYDSKYSDSLIYDKVTISATNEAGEEVVTSGSASVCIGDCPRGCFEISDDNEVWQPNYSSTLTTAIAELTSKFPSFVDKACSGEPVVKLCYTTKDPSPIGDSLCVGNIFAIHKHTPGGCDINFNQCSLDGDPKDAFFLLTHELSHHIQKIDGGDMINRYENAGAHRELPLCTYSGTNGNAYEGSAEANALYATGGVASFSTCSTNFQSQYPLNYRYSSEYMNNP